MTDMTDVPEPKPVVITTINVLDENGEVLTSKQCGAIKLLPGDEFSLTFTFTMPNDATSSRIGGSDAVSVSHTP